jgi:hypothetical protein
MGAAHLLRNAPISYNFAYVDALYLSALFIFFSNTFFTIGSGRTASPAMNRRSAPRQGGGQA